MSTYLIGAWTEKPSDKPINTLPDWLVIQRQPLTKTDAQRETDSLANRVADQLNDSETK